MRVTAIASIKNTTKTTGEIRQKKPADVHLLHLPQNGKVWLQKQFQGLVLEHKSEHSLLRETAGIPLVRKLSCTS